MQDISGFGLQVRVVASVTFPAGITITQFADDSDPLDQPSVQIKDKAMGLNGDALFWAKANPILATLNVIAGSSDDINLGILFENNRVGRGKNSVQDEVTMMISYPDGSTQSLINGAMTDGMPGNSVASAGRLKSKPYIFAFENKVNT